MRHDETPDRRAVAPAGPALVPSQPNRPRTTTARRGPQPSLRALGVPGTAGLVRSADSPDTQVLRCTSAALRTVHALVLGGSPDPRALAQAVESDPVLTLRVLHRANAGHRPGGAVDTVPQALSVLGPAALETLVRELAATATATPMPGLARVLTLALACVELSTDRTAYTVGLLAGLATEIGVPEELVVQVAGVSQETADAVRHGRGPLGKVLRGLLAYEAGDTAALARSGLAAVDAYDTYLRAASDAMATAAALRTTTTGGPR